MIGRHIADDGIYQSCSEVFEGYGPRLGKAKFFFDGRLCRYQLGLTPSREVASNELDRFPLGPQARAFTSASPPQLLRQFSVASEEGAAGRIPSPR
jgi:hypothetical protein